MLQEYKTKTNIGVGLGLALQIVGNVMVDGSEQAGLILGLVAMLAGVAIFIWGCMSYSRGKGQSLYLGFLGLLSIVGLVVLVLLPDKHKAG
jgi:hypothetical protein